ncbi:hypothetical protein SD71_04545 [Cohnella kolymensis]|uniref:CRISPR-associated protein Cas6 C-terminal domain-containing protein n=1 Tax=Cohnella kolymensis TaxID=1590652 RepID=A0ABR5A7H9_9BACL|nr:CRISPR system precrRNA processing endoribonuclease RAMP protein Cas6 [Cohnella kolymensis]KIL36973.1 hypothetical protein SD71_04545 [Cohnella kolymensis]
MIASIVLRFAAEQLSASHSIFPVQIHRFIYEKMNHSKLARYYHDSPSSPFAVKRITFVAATVMELQIIFFHFELFQAFCATCRTGETVIGGEVKLHLTAIAVHPEDHPDAGLVSYESLNHMPLKRGIRLYFRHAAFHNGGHTIVLPIPHYIVKSLLRKWMQAGGQRLVEKEVCDQQLASGLRITSHQIYTQPYSLQPSVKITTFSGNVHVLNTHEDVSLQRALQKLIYFAHYSGVGWKCAYGMGGVDVHPL